MDTWTPSPAAQPPDFGLQVSSRTHSNVWRFVLVMRALCCVFLALTAAFYVYLSRPEMTYLASMLGPSATRDLQVVGAVFSGLLAAHAYAMVSMLGFSLQYNRLVYARDAKDQRDLLALVYRYVWRQQRSSIHPSGASVPSPATVDSLDTPSIRRVACSVWRRVQRAYQKLYGRRGVFGVESEYFELDFALREVVEIASQTIQAYYASLLIASPVINTLYVAVITLNCWSGPVVSHVYHHYEDNRRRARRANAISRQLSGRVDLLDAYMDVRSLALERVWCLCTEIVLDIGAAMLVPALIFAPYARVFDVHAHAFPVELVYDDVWFVNMVMATQQLFVASPFDFVFTMAPHVGIYLGLNKLVSLAKVTDTTASVLVASRSRSVVSPPTTTTRVASSLFLDRLRKAHAEPGLELKTFRVQLARTELRINSIAKTLLHGVFVFWGAVILLLHAASFLSYTDAHVRGCRQRVRPWLAFDLPCAVFEYNCLEHNTMSVPESAFKGLESNVLAALLVTHCPALVVPTTIRAFRYLIGLEIYNSTIVAWPQHAAVSDASHPNLKYLFLGRVNMTRLPVGVLEPLPRGFVDFEIVGCNLTDLPTDLAARWNRHALPTLSIEHCALNEFPVALTRLQVKDLSLHGNPIRSMHSVRFDKSVVDPLATIVLSGTPLRDLPDEMPPMVTTLKFVSVENTELAVFPSWVDTVLATHRTTTIYAAGTPFCASLPPEVVHAKYGHGAAITCVDRSRFADGRLPLDLQAKRRQLAPGR